MTDWLKNFLWNGMKLKSQIREDFQKEWHRYSKRKLVNILLNKTKVRMNIIIKGNNNSIQCVLLFHFLSHKELLNKLNRTNSRMSSIRRSVIINKIKQWNKVCSVHCLFHFLTWYWFTLNCIVIKTL